jgi:hypothetical protein
MRGTGGGLSGGDLVAETGLLLNAAPIARVLDEAGMNWAGGASSQISDPSRPLADIA